MYLIGLTGGIASGKSTVSRMLHSQGAFIVDVDKISREIAKPGRPAYQDIVKFFGQSIVQDNGEIDRKHLGQLVFANKQARFELEQITHPYIEAAANAAIAAADASGFAVIVIDAPLLIEAGWHTKVDAVWVVYVDEHTQLSRLMARDNCSEAAARERMNAQLTLQEKLKYADVIINNGDSIDSTHNRVIQAYQEIAVPR